MRLPFILPRSGSFYLLAAFLAPVVTLSVLAAQHYRGNLAVFVVFALLSNALLLNGFRRDALYFDTFIGLFLWLGFFLKLAIRVAFMGSAFSEPTGRFDGSGAAFDHALTIASVAFAALLAASALRQRLFRYPAEAPSCIDTPLYRFYCSHRRVILTAFLLSLLVVAASNVWLGIYQRGMMTRTVLPFGLNGVYKWLLQFGFASFSALVVRFEIERSRQASAVAILLPLAESFASNVSLLSRGMILNMSAIGIGTWRTMRSTGVRIGVSRLLVSGLLFAVLFAVSVYSVNYLRMVAHESVGELGEARSEVARRMSTPLFIDRWVGMEGLMAISSSRELGWDIWREAWREKYDERKLSLYDSRFIDSPYTNPDNVGKVHYVSLPGIVAFLFYPGSLTFLFVALIAIGLLAALFEVAIYRFCGRNWILCSLIAQVIAFRLASFGYVPAQSYLLFGTIVLNGLLIWGASQALSLRYLNPVSSRQ